MVRGDLRLKNLVSSLGLFLPASVETEMQKGPSKLSTPSSQGLVAGAVPLGGGSHRGGAGSHAVNKGAAFLQMVK